MTRHPGAEPLPCLNNRINVKTGPHEHRQLMTGEHICADLMCQHCDSLIGWKYISATSEDQKYKVGDPISRSTL